MPSAILTIGGEVDPGFDNVLQQIRGRVEALQRQISGADRPGRGGGAAAGVGAAAEGAVNAAMERATAAMARNLTKGANAMIQQMGERFRSRVEGRASEVNAWADTASKNINQQIGTTINRAIANHIVAIQSKIKTGAGNTAASNAAGQATNVLAEAVTQAVATMAQTAAGKIVSRAQIAQPATAASVSSLGGPLVGGTGTAPAAPATPTTGGGRGRFRFPPWMHVSDSGNAWMVGGAFNVGGVIFRGAQEAYGLAAQGYENETRTEGAMLSGYPAVGTNVQAILNERASASRMFRERLLAGGMPSAAVSADLARKAATEFSLVAGATPAARLADFQNVLGIIAQARGYDATDNGTEGFARYGFMLRSSIFGGRHGADVDRMTSLGMAAVQQIGLETRVDPERLNRATLNQLLTAVQAGTPGGNTPEAQFERYKEFLTATAFLMRMPEGVGAPTELVGAGRIAALYTDMNSASRRNNMYQGLAGYLINRYQGQGLSGDALVSAVNADLGPYGHLVPGTRHGRAEYGFEVGPGDASFQQSPAAGLRQYIAHLRGRGITAADVLKFGSDQTAIGRLPMIRRSRDALAAAMGNPSSAWTPYAGAILTQAQADVESRLNAPENTLALANAAVEANRAAEAQRLVDMENRRSLGLASELESRPGLRQLHQYTYDHPLMSSFGGSILHNLFLGAVFRGSGFAGAMIGGAAGAAFGLNQGYSLGASGLLGVGGAALGTAAALRGGRALGAMGGWASSAGSRAGTALMRGLLMPTRLGITSTGVSAGLLAAVGAVASMGALAAAGSEDAEMNLSRARFRGISAAGRSIAADETQFTEAGGNNSQGFGGFNPHSLMYRAFAFTDRLGITDILPSRLVGLKGGAVLPQGVRAGSTGVANLYQTALDASPGAAVRAATGDDYRVNAATQGDLMRLAPGTQIGLDADTIARLALVLGHTDKETTRYLIDRLQHNQPPSGSGAQPMPNAATVSPRAGAAPTAQEPPTRRVGEL